PLLGPGDGRPPALVELALPRPPALHRLHDPARAGRTRVVVGAGPLLEERRQVLVEPAQQLGPARLVLRRVGEIHVLYPGGDPAAPPSSATWGPRSLRSRLTAAVVASYAVIGGRG